MYEINNIYKADAAKGMKKLKDNTIYLTVTSPPYGEIRTYNGFKWDFKATAKQLYRVTKSGGVVVWVVADQVIDGSESGESFRQALFFKDQCGFRLHDTMIYQKNGISHPSTNRYSQCFEYMFIFSKGRPKTVNILKDRPLKWNAVTWKKSGIRNRDGSIEYKYDLKQTSPYGQRLNIWIYNVGFQHTTKDKVAKDHPALMPESLAQDHILSWSNPGDLILDPFSGGGTTCKMAKILGRKYLGFDISQEYVDIGRQRLQDSVSLHDTQNRWFCNFLAKKETNGKYGQF